MMEPVRLNAHLFRFVYADCFLGVVKLDPWLEPFSGALRRRYSKAQDWIKSINDSEGGIDKFSKVSILNCNDTRSDR
jgi:hypothetical protein